MAEEKKLDDGWIEWRGGKSPDVAGKLVDVRLADGVEYTSVLTNVLRWEWAYSGGMTDIIAYRLAANQQPKADADADGWIEWTGGECPVPDGTVVEYRMRNDEECKDEGHRLDWVHRSYTNDIIAYRLAAQQPAASPAPAGEAATGPNPVYHLAVPGYEPLAGVLRRAYGQAATGKGAERHAKGQPFHQQPMQQLIALYGVGFALGQAAKKAQESQRLPRDRAIAELLGAINYLAGAVIALERQDTKD